MNEKKMRIIMAILGVTICGFSVGFFKVSLFGADPYQSFITGLSNIIPLSYGTIYIIVNIINFAVIWFVGRRYIGIATFINLFLLGYMVEFSEYLLNTIFGEIGLVTRIVFLIIGVVILCLSSAFYYTADLGVSTYDAISLLLADKKVAKFKYLRIGTDLICVGIGFAFGAVIGIGTLVTAFFMGPLIDFFRNKVSEPLLAKYK